MCSADNFHTVLFVRETDLEDAMSSISSTVRAARIAGALFVVEALASPFEIVRAEIQYHGPNSLLNLAVAIAALGIYRSAKERIGRSGRVGARVLVFAATIAGVGGLVSLSFALSEGKSPGLVEGVVHTAVLLAILAMVPFAVGLRRSVNRPGLLMLVASAMIVALVLIGLDSPWIFFVPEALLGAAWWWTGSAIDAHAIRDVQPALV